jgi:hypothetical protein
LNDDSQDISNIKDYINTPGWKYNIFSKSENKTTDRGRKISDIKNQGLSTDDIYIKKIEKEIVATAEHYRKSAKGFNQTSVAFQGF